MLPTAVNNHRPHKKTETKTKSLKTIKRYYCRLTSHAWYSSNISVRVWNIVPFVSQSFGERYKISPLPIDIKLQTIIRICIYIICNIYINKYLYYITKSAPLIHWSASKTSNSILCEKRFHSFVHRYRYLSLQILWNEDKVILFINICQPYLLSLFFLFLFFIVLLFIWTSTSFLYFVESFVLQEFAELCYEVSIRRYVRRFEDCLRRSRPSHSFSISHLARAGIRSYTYLSFHTRFAQLNIWFCKNV